MPSRILSNLKDKRKDVENMSQGGGRWDIKKGSDFGRLTRDNTETDEKRDRRGQGREVRAGTGGQAKFHRIK